MWSIVTLKPQMNQVNDDKRFWNIVRNTILIISSLCMLLSVLRLIDKNQLNENPVFMIVALVYSLVALSIVNTEHCGVLPR